MTNAVILQFDEISYELEEQRELASNRLTELERLSKEHQETLQEVQKLKMDVSMVGTKEESHLERNASSDFLSPFDQGISYCFVNFWLVCRSARICAIGMFNYINFKSCILIHINNVKIIHLDFRLYT